MITFDYPHQRAPDLGAFWFRIVGATTDAGAYAASAEDALLMGYTPEELDAIRLNPKAGNTDKLRDALVRRPIKEWLTCH